MLDGRRSLQDALDRNAHEGLRLAAPVLSGLLGFFALADLFIVPSRWAVQVALVDLAATAAIFLVYLGLRLGRIEPRHSHVVGAAVAGSVALTVFHDTYVLGDPEQTTYLMLVVVGAGSVFLSIRWLYIVVTGSLVGWMLVAASRPDVNWTTFGFALFAACIVSVLIHAVRYNTFERMEALRLEESGRKEQLEIRESALQSAVEALQESEERYRRLVEDAPDAFLVRSEGKIAYANTAALKLFGARTPQEMLGREILTLVHPDFRAQVEARGRTAGSSRQSMEPLEMTWLRLDGTPVEVEVVSQPLTYLGQPATQTVVRDMTDRKRAESDRQVAAQRLAEISRLKEMDRVKTQFVNTISHELRTPLTPIKVQLHILKGSKDAESMRKSAEVLERNVGRLASLVDELLEVARIQAGTLKLAKTYVDISSVVGQALDSFWDVARSQGIDLSSKLEPDVNVLGDAKRLQQIVYNLMGNAFKFTQKGGHIMVEVRRQGNDALVTVTDSGAGMGQQDIERLFEPFSQVHDTMEKTNAGTGLGLYICRGIVEGHGGRIWAESEGAGKGARFAFTIPLIQKQ